MTKNLLCEFKNENYCYYGEGDVRNPFQDFSNDSSLKYIQDTFRCGRKSAALNVYFKAEFCDKGKHMHTVSLYYLGCYLQEMIDQDLTAFIGEYVPSSTERNDNWYNFKYTWFLTCLYHDTASVIEKPQDYLIENERKTLKANGDIYHYTGEYMRREYSQLSDVEYQESDFYDVWDHKFTDDCKYKTFFEKKTILEYFRYKADIRNEIDHGILGGMILFDKLTRNYYVNRKEYCDCSGEDYCCAYTFNYDDLIWRKEHLDHFAIIADAIIAHNVWFQQSKIKCYQLDELILNGKTFGIKKNPLYFWLTLLDTIEPVKWVMNFMDRSGSNTFEICDKLDMNFGNFSDFEMLKTEVAKKMLEITSITYDDKNKTIIIQCDNQWILEKWYADIEKIDWLNINTENNQANSSCDITITKKQKDRNLI